MKNKFTDFADGLLALFYPDLCLACRSNPPPDSEILCVQCLYKLPQTKFHLHKENAFTERFWGRLPLHAGASLYRFTKGGHVQQLIHQLKYKGKKEVGIKTGHFYGLQLKKSPLFLDVDIIVPVPLHPKKKHRRGYNQSNQIAKGLSEAMGISWTDKGLVRKDFTGTQTKKSRMERLKNVQDAFVVGNQSLLNGKHVLLVDDVITTGATMETCGLTILALTNTKLSMVTLAFSDV